MLVAGGAGQATAELYNPGTGQWAPTGTMSTGRDLHTATRLQSGKVLVAGGEQNGYPMASAELYNPATSQWTATGALGIARSGHTATLLPNGKVLVAGGYGAGYDAELYNPATGTWSPTGSMSGYRVNHTATLLADGRVLVAGGTGSVASSELYNPATGQWTPTGSMNIGRYLHTATRLPSGEVLVAGGNGNGGNWLDSAELYDPATGLWAAAGEMSDSRGSHAAALLADGRVLVVGGQGNGGTLSGAELYDPEAREPWSAVGECWYDQFGSSLAGAGDVDGDGYDDLVIGAPHVALWRRRTRQSIPIRGGADGPAAQPSWTAEGEDYGYELGISVAGAGDVNGDGYDDVAIGAYGYPTYNTYQGKAYLFAGSASGLSADPAWTATGESAGDRFGNSVAGAGDVDRDGYDDFLVGAYGYPGGAFEGRFTLYYGSPAGVGTSGWTQTGSLASPRQQHTATALSDGRVLVAGGWGGGASAELYDPATGLWAPTGSMNASRMDHTATLLADGRVLVAAGRAAPTAPRSITPRRASGR